MPSLLSRFLPGKPERKDRITEALLLGLGDNRNPTRNYAALVTESYETNGIASRAVRMLADAASSIPYLLTQTTTQGTEDVPQHELLTLLQHPNQNESGRQLRSLIYADLAMAGEAFLLKNGPRNSAPTELYRLRPDKVTVTPAARMGAQPTYRYAATRDNATTYPANRIIHIRTLNPLQPHRGFSPLTSIATDLDQSNLAGKWNVSLLRNAGRPSLLVMTKGSLTDAQKQQLRSAQESLMAGAANAGRIAAFSGDDVTIKDIGFSPTDMDWREGQKAVESRIATGLGVPPELLNLGQVTFNNRAEAKRSFYEETVLPLHQLVTEALNHHLVPDFGTEGLTLTPYLERVAALQPNKRDEYSRLDASWAAGWLTLNDVRTEAGFDPDDQYGALYKWQADALARFGYVPTTGKSAKAINLRTPEAKAAHWWNVENHRRAWDRQFQTRVQALFRDLHDHLKAAAAPAETPDDLKRILSDPNTYPTEPWVRAFSEMYQALMQEFGNRTLDALKAAHGPPETKGFEDVFGVMFDSVLQWVGREAAQAIVNIHATTRTQITNLITRGIDDGLSIRDIQKGIDSLMLDQIIPHRSETIARTEVMKASEKANLEAARGTGLPLRKVWLATQDDRTRDDHSFADGQAVQIDAAFDVGGYAMDGPGDASMGAPASEIINCRCTTLFETPS